MKPTTSRIPEPRDRPAWPCSTVSPQVEVNHNYNFSPPLESDSTNPHYDFSTQATHSGITASDMSQPLVAVHKAEAFALRRVVGQDQVIPELVRLFYRHVRRALFLLDGPPEAEGDLGPLPSFGLLTGPSGVGKGTAVAAVSAAFSLPLVTLSVSGRGPDGISALIEAAAARLCSRGREIYLEHHADPVTRAQASDESPVPTGHGWVPRRHQLLDHQIISFSRLFGVLLVTDPGEPVLNPATVRGHLIDELRRRTESHDELAPQGSVSLLVFVSTKSAPERSAQGPLEPEVFSFRRLGRSHLETITARGIGQLVRSLDGGAFPDLSNIGAIRFRRECVGVIADRAIQYGTAAAVERIMQLLPAKLSTHVRRSGIGSSSCAELEITAELLRRLLRDQGGVSS